jgi:hypothetical protein
MYYAERIKILALTMGIVGLLGILFLSDHLFLNQDGPLTNVADRAEEVERFTDCKRYLTRVERQACRIGGAALGIVSALRRPIMSAHDDFRAFAAIEAANRVRYQVSPARYSFLTQQMGPVPKGSEICLEEAAGICGNQVQVYMDIMRNLNIPVRPIQFYYSDNGERASHIAVEVYYGGRWNYIDVTWGFAVPIGKLPSEAVQFRSINEIQPKDIDGGHINDFDAWSLNYTLSRIDVLKYLKLPKVDVVIDGEGVINIAVPERDVYREGFANIPNYIGDRQKDGRQGALSYRIKTAGRYRLSLDVKRTLGCSALDHIVMNAQKRSVTKGRLEFDVVDEATLTIATEQDVCYAVLAGMEFRQVKS